MLRFHGRQGQILLGELLIDERVDADSFREISCRFTEVRPE